ncbi:DNA-directed RNA polymerase III subunit RPC9 isoform X2 [Vulpes lagopus]|uniref:DNA-directed RNA polymerase III subunit RPC9 isoform X2 n=1 Tax=Vulpes lagopus TaxID=494514 RepID=UPI001BC8D5A6|nr:DNA-directed RNA polymerase III subunit RPC9 isoform X2 [Vulpes lagopus]
MEVKDANSALLSNYEVFQLLTDLKEQRKESGKNKHSSGQQNLNTITYETLKYISKTPCRHQTPEIVREFLTAMKSHKLTKAEKLQLLNHRPMTAVEIQLMLGLLTGWLLRTVRLLTQKLAPPEKTFQEVDAVRLLRNLGTKFKNIISAAFFWPYESPTSDSWDSTSQWEE